MSVVTVETNTHEITVAPKSKPRAYTVYYVLVKWIDSGNYIEVIEWNIRERNTEYATKEALRLLSADPAWQPHLSQISIACVAMSNLTWRQGEVIEQPAKLVVK